MNLKYLKSNIETIINDTYQTSKTTYKYLKKNKKIRRLYHSAIAISENAVYYYYLSKSEDYVEKQGYDPAILALPLIVIAAYVLGDGISRIFANENLFKFCKRMNKELKEEETKIKKIINTKF